MTLSFFPANPIVAQTDDRGTNVQLFTLDSIPFGTPYNEWTSIWWMWLISTPLSESPAADSNGQYCAKSQTGPVWFLAGTFQGSAERTCEIPAGKGILFPVFNAECSFAEYPNLKTDSELSQCAKELIDKVTFVQATIDGVQIQNISRTQSPPFAVTFPEENIFGVQAGPTRAVSDGFWIFLQPLSAGNHVINFKGALIDYTTTGIVSVTNDVTYHLIAVAVPEGANQTQSIPLQG
ncbi:MAG TPA: hypothetical protein VKA09_06540 [Nitrososphaeraceae archaeon]|nr:hypothetical protein [Nitrososphaeraceae archaeon]